MAVKPKPQEILWHTPGAIGPLWVNPDKRFSLAMLTTTLAIGMFVIWALQNIGPQKIAPYSSVLLGVAGWLLVSAVMFVSQPSLATYASVSAIIASWIFVLSTTYRSIFVEPVNPLFLIGYISASTSYILLQQVFTYALFQRGSNLLSGLTCLGVTGFVLFRCFLDGRPINPAAQIPMIVIVLGPLINMVGLNYLVSWRNEAAEREILLQHEKEKLMAMMSHEIRGQLQTTLSTSELLSARLTDPMTVRSLARLSLVTKQLDRYLRDWVELVRLDNPQINYEVRNFSLVDQVDQAVEEHQNSAKAKSLVLSSPVWSDLPPDTFNRWKNASGDPVRFRQVLDNLISNALKYTQQGAITVRVRSVANRPNEALILVSDTGPGIPPEKIQRIFEPFQRLSSIATHGIDGSGLGLSIAHRVIQRVGGQLTVDSALGKGTSFCVHWPILLKPH